MPLTEAQYIPNGRTIVNALAFDDTGKTVITRDINGRILFVGNLTTTPVEILAWDPITQAVTMGALAGGSIQFTTDGTFATGNPAVGRSGALLVFIGGTSATVWNNNANTNERMRLTDGGILTMGGQGTAGATSGEIVLPYGKAVRGVNNANTTTLPLIWSAQTGAVDYVGVGPLPNVVAIGGPGSLVNAIPGDLVLPNSRYLRASNFANSASIPLIGLVASTNVVQVGGTGSTPQIVAIGTPVVTNGIGVGGLVLGNGNQIGWSKADGSTALEMMRLSVNNILIIGSGGAITTIGEPLTTTGASAGDLVLPNSRSVRIQNSGGTNTSPITTMTLATGSGAGDYTTTSASYVDIDGTNLKFVVTIPTGFSLLVNTTCTVKHSTLAATVGLAIKDGSVVAEEVIEAAVAGDREHMGLTHMIVGDDASHSITLQWKTSAATATMSNSSATFRPRMTFFMAPSS